MNMSSPPTAIRLWGGELGRERERLGVRPEAHPERLGDNLDQRLRGNQRVRSPNAPPPASVILWMETHFPCDDVAIVYVKDLKGRGALLRRFLRRPAHRSAQQPHVAELIGKRHPKTRGGCGAGENSLPPRAPQCRIGPEGRHNVEMPPGRVPQHRRRPPERDPPARMPTFVRGLDAAKGISERD